MAGVISRVVCVTPSHVCGHALDDALTETDRQCRGEIMTRFVAQTVILFIQQCDLHTR